MRTPLASGIIGLAALLSAPPQAPGQSSPAAALPLQPRVTLTVLAENTVAEKAPLAEGHALLPEWGLAVLIEAGTHRVLFDTGAGRALVPNARELKADLSRLDAIVISHGHSDHTASLDAVLKIAGKVDLFVHPAAFDTLFSRQGSSVQRRVATPTRAQLAERAVRLVETRGPTLVAGSVMATGGVPRVTDFEDTGIVGQVYRDEAMTKPDIVPEDQAVFFRVPEGIVVLVGCAHAGVVNTIEYVAKLTGENRIHAVIGGTHLLTASPARMKRTEEALRRFGVQRIMLAHCTGQKAYGELSAAFPGQCSWPGAGSRVEFGR